jgi:hypothetical protein
MVPANPKSGETTEERKLRRDALLQYGPLFSTALRFSFDWPDENVNRRGQKGVAGEFANEED